MYGITKRRTTWALALAMGLGAVTSFASAADTVELSKVPKAAREQIHEAAKGGTKVDVYDLGEQGGKGPVFMAHYTAPTGKRMEIKVTETGTVLSQGETQSQRRKDAEEQLTAAKTDAEKAKVAEQLALQRDAEDKAHFEAWKASQAQQAAAHVGATPVAPVAVPGVSTPAVPAAASHAGMTLKELSEEYNGTDRQRVAATALPAGVKKTLDMETLGTKNVDYYKYTVDGKTFYSAHYDQGANERTVCRVDDTGKLLGKNEITGAGQIADLAAHKAGK